MASNQKLLINRRAREIGFDVCRVTSADAPLSAGEFLNWLKAGRHGEMGYLQRNAHKRVEPQEVLPGARSILVLASSYYFPGTKREATPSKNHQGVVARYAQYQDYHDVLGEHLRKLADFVNQLGGPATRSLWYVDTGPLLERDLAQRAGAGFIGKHTNLINRSLGNWIFLSEIITTLELSPDPPEKNRCGSCTRCIEACPTEAITAPFQLDARRCISYLTIELKGAIPVEFRRAIGNRIYGCDACLEACPWNRFAKASQLIGNHLRPDLNQPNLLELLSLDEQEFRRRFSGSPMARTKRRGLLRNVCVALGNIGDENALPALMKASADSESLIAEHAQWAIEEIEGRRKNSLINCGSKRETAP